MFYYFLPLFKLSKQFFFKNSNLLRFFKNLKFINFTFTNKNAVSIFFYKNLKLKKSMFNLELTNNKKNIKDNELLLLKKFFFNLDKTNFFLFNTINFYILNLKEIYKAIIILNLMKIIN